MTTAAPTTLRQRKKDRTRRTIIDVGTALFAKQGYDETTLAQVADVAEIAPSTFFNYFSSKADIVFGLHDALSESAREYIIERSQGKPARVSVVEWISDELPGVEAPFTEVLRRIRRSSTRSPSSRPRTGFASPCSRTSSSRRSPVTSTSRRARCARA